MVISCPNCRQNTVVDAAYYGTPLFRCPACGATFVTDKIHEPELSSRPSFQRENVECYIYFGMGFGVLMALLSFYFLFDQGTEALWGLLFGVLISSGCFWMIWDAKHGKDKQAADYERIRQESERRLRDFSYQDQLAVCSNFNPQMITALRQFNSIHNLKHELPAASSRSCSHCGAGLPDGSQFCPKCGMKI